MDEKKLATLVRGIECIVGESRDVPERFGYTFGSDRIYTALPTHVSVISFGRVCLDRYCI